MDTGMTPEQMCTLLFRRDRLEGRLQKVKDLLSGRMSSFLPLVRDEKGRFSESRAWVLIDQLLEAFHTYLSFQPRRQAPPPSKEDETLYRTFLYCAIRYAECPPTWESNWYILPSASGTYSDLLQLAGCLTGMELPDLLYYENYAPVAVDAFFAYMNEMYDHLSPKSIVFTASDADLLLMQETHQKELLEFEAIQKEMEDLPDLDDFYDELVERSPEEWDQLSEGRNQMLEEAYQNDQAQTAWKEAFQEKESFLRQYLLFRSVYFKAPARQTLAKDIENMLEVFLVEQGRSGLMDDDAFFSTLTMLGKVTKLIQQMPGQR